jgi:dTDP-glucose 4,6-dehydratase
MLLVLGGSSFSGNAFVSHRLSSGEKVASFERTKHSSQIFSAIRPSSLEHYTQVQFNLNSSTQEIIDFINLNQVEIVVNFAAQSMVGQSWSDSEDWYQANVTSFAKLANKLSRETNISKFVHFSTPEVYGNSNGWLKENFNFKPNTPYAISRAAGDWHLKALHENSGFPVIFTRAANVFGQHQQLYRIVPKAIISALTGRTLPLQGGGKSFRSFIHIEDVNRALDLILSNGNLGETYHISTKELVSIHDLVQKIASKMNVNFESLVEVTPDRPGKDFAYQLDSAKIRTEFGWNDEVNLDQGLDRTIAWVERNLGELRNMPAEYIHRK